MGIPFAVVSTSKIIKIISLVYGTVTDEMAYPVSGIGLLLRVSTSTGKPKFVRDRNFREANERQVRGGLESHLPVTNVDLNEDTKKEIDELLQALNKDKESFR